MTICPTVINLDKHIQSVFGNRPAKTIVPPPKGAKNVYLKTQWTEFYQIGRTCSGGKYEPRSEVSYWSWCAFLCFWSIYCELERATDMKLGTITGVIMLHKKTGPNWPDSGVIINIQKSENFERSLPPHCEPNWPKIWHTSTTECALQKSLLDNNGHHGGV